MKYVIDGSNFIQETGLSGKSVNNIVEIFQVNVFIVLNSAFKYVIFLFST
jgi:hypothetical protein